MKKSKFILPVTAFALLLSLGLSACNNGGNQGEASQGGEQQSQPAEQSIPADAKIKITAAGDKTKLMYGETVQLSADVQGVSWESSKPDIVSVSADGLVTALAKGSASIKAKKDGYKDGSISISVDYPNITITAAGNKTSLLVNETVNLSASEQGVTWTSSNAEVASVANGVVTALKLGTATIKASKEHFNDGSITINVVRPDPTATLHWEDADHFAVDGWWGDGENGATPVYARDSGNASDAQCIAHLDAGDKETLAFTSSAAVNAELVITMASSSSVSDMSAVVSAKLNDAAITIPAVEFSTGSNSEFAEFSLGVQSLKAGDNALELSFLASAPYIDNLDIYAESAATIVVKAAPIKEQIEVKLAEGETGLKAYIGEETQIELVKPTSLEGVSFASDKESVATVSDAGKITGVALGTANITIMKAGYYSARVEVVVEKAVLAGEIRVEAENTTNELPSGFHKYTDKTSGITNGHSGSAYITGYDVNSACSLEYAFESSKDQTMTLIIAGAPHYQMSEPFNFATDCEILLNGEKVTVNAEAQIEPGSTMGAATVEVTIGDVSVKAGNNTFVINFAEKAPALDCYRFMPKA